MVVYILVLLFVMVMSSLVGISRVIGNTG